MLHVFLTDVCDCYVLVADGVCLLFFFFFFVFIVSHHSKFSVVIQIFFHLLYFVPYNWNDLSHRRPALMVLTFSAANHIRNVIFFSLVYLLWLINLSSLEEEEVLNIFVSLQIQTHFLCQLCVTYCRFQFPLFVCFYSTAD